MNKISASLIVPLFIFPLGIVSAENSSNEVQSTPAPESITESIKGAFGILLGKKFNPSMVNKVIDEQPKSYSAKNKTKLQGTLFQVEPHKPDIHFQSYSVKTTGEGVIYAIQANYQYEVEKAQGKKSGKVKREKVIRSTCKDAVKKLATELETQYGEPRGKGWNGEWYTFRQLSDTSDKSLRLYANECRSGKYSIIYTDLKIQQNIKQ